jgi:hypothetical protein
MLPMSCPNTKLGNQLSHMWSPPGKLHAVPAAAAAAATAATAVMSALLHLLVEVIG